MTKITQELSEKGNHKSQLQTRRPQSGPIASKYEEEIEIQLLT